MLFNDHFIKLRGHPDLMARLGGRRALVDRLIDADEQSTRMIAASRKAGAALNQDAAFGRSAARLQQREAAMDIKRNGSQPSAKGPADWFTGVVRIDPLFQAPDPARVAGASVTFEPGARTAWHTHPLGQTLIVTFGVGRAQRWGGPIEEIRPSDVVWFAPGEKHWHGASPAKAMTHIAIQEGLNGKLVDWMEQVSDAQYRA
jgi:quercetin dioxygenase-like cupin family protein